MDDIVHSFRILYTILLHLIWSEFTEETSVL